MCRPPKPKARTRIHTYTHPLPYARTHPTPELVKICDESGDGRVDLIELISAASRRPDMFGPETFLCASIVTQKIQNPHFSLDALKEDKP